MTEPLDAFDVRARQLLKVLVETYIREGVPVPSRRLATTAGVSVSPATVRNIMAELEAQGLVRSPHTSAGKVPTQRGFRLFVDSLLTVQPLDERAVSLLRHELNPDLPAKSLIESASRLLSHVTHMAGLVTLPRLELPSLRHVEFLPLAGNRVLVILVSNEKDVQNRVVRTDREFSESELVQASNYINREFVGRSLGEVRAALLAAMSSERDRISSMMQAVLAMAEAFAPETDSADFVLAGETNLIDLASDSSMDTVRALFESFARKRDLLHLLDRVLSSPGVQLFIGAESGNEVFGDVSLVTSAYAIDGRVAGVLGVIGPTRMAYQQIIPLVDMTARLLGAALEPPAAS